MEEIAIKRHSIRGHLPLAVHRHVLRCAAVSGRLDLATGILDMMAKDGITPDLATYNYGMEACNWNNAFRHDQRWNLFNSPKLVEMRKATRPTAKRLGYSIGSPVNNFFGPKSFTLDLFSRLSKQGLKGDETTFVNLIIAMGREQDMQGIQSILKSVWNIDVDMLLRYDEEEFQSPNFYDEGHPLHPSNRLLFAVVHAYCINNQPSTGFTLLDYISRNYNLNVPVLVWQELFEWFHRLSIRPPRHKQAQHQKRPPASVRLEVIFDLVKTIYDEPYNVTATVWLKVLETRAALRGKKIDYAINTLREAVALHTEQKASLYECLLELLECVSKIESRVKVLEEEEVAFGWADVVQADYFAAKRKFTTKFLETNANINHMARTTEFVIFRQYTESLSWYRQSIPDLITEFRQFLPNSVSYQTPTGIVEFEVKKERVSRVWETDADIVRRAGYVMSVVDKFEPNGLRGLLQMRSRLRSSESHFKKIRRSEGYGDIKTLNPFEDKYVQLLQGGG